MAQRWTGPAPQVASEAGRGRSRPTSGVPPSEAGSPARGANDGGIRRPASMRIIVSALAASACRCVTWTTVIPPAASDSSRATTSARPGASIIAVASSEISSRGSRANEAAIASRCSSPPDSPAVSRSSKPCQPHPGEQRAHVWSHASEGAPRPRRRGPGPRAPGSPASGRSSRSRQARRAPDRPPGAPCRASATSARRAGAPGSTSPSRSGRRER